MMKRISLRNLKITSPRKERCTSGHESDSVPSPPPPHSQPHDTVGIVTHNNESFSGGHDSILRHHNDNGHCTPKKKGRKSIFNTIKRKLTPSKKRESAGEFGVGWTDQEAASSNTVPAKNLTGSWKPVHRRFQKPLRTAHSEERIHDLERLEGACASIATSGAHTLRYGRDTRSVGAVKSAAHACDGCGRSRESSSVSKSEDESSGKEEPIIESEKSPFLFDTPHHTAYGHASAPSNGDLEVPSEVADDALATLSPLSNTAEATLHFVELDHECISVIGQKPQIVPRTIPHERFEPYLASAGDELELPPRHPLTQPLYDQVKDLEPKAWSLTRELFKLSKFGWYWGPITRVEAEEKLGDQTDGAFLVRDSSDERYLLSLSFRSYGRTLHTRIEHCNGVFSFYAQPESEGYTSIVDLIEHSMSDSQTGVFCYSRARTPGSPSFPVRLTKPVSRFTQVRSLQYLCRFIIRQYTRYDHIQKLPLPSSIRGWLEENQY